MKRALLAVPSWAWWLGGGGLLLLLVVRYYYNTLIKCRVFLWTKTLVL